MKLQANEGELKNLKRKQNKPNKNFRLARQFKEWVEWNKAARKNWPKNKKNESQALLREGEAQHQTVLVIYEKRQVFKKVYLQRAWV